MCLKIMENSIHQRGKKDKSVDHDQVDHGIHHIKDG
jgi:hypothetical protein